jgi:hypothetical protein
VNKSLILKAVLVQAGRCSEKAAVFFGAVPQPFYLSLQHLLRSLEFRLHLFLLLQNSALKSQSQDVFKICIKKHRFPLKTVL